MAPPTLFGNRCKKLCVAPSSDFLNIKILENFCRRIDSGNFASNSSLVWHRRHRRHCSSRWRWRRAPTRV